MQPSSDKPAAGSSGTTTDFLKRRLDATAEGLKEGIRREIARREKLGLPIYVDDHGTVVDLQSNRMALNATEP